MPRTSQKHRRALQTAGALNNLKGDGSNAVLCCSQCSAAPTCPATAGRQMFCTSQKTSACSCNIDGSRARARASTADGNAVDPTTNLQFSCQVLSAMGNIYGIPNWHLRKQGWRYISIAIAQGNWETIPVRTCTIQSEHAKGK